MRNDLSVRQFERERDTHTKGLQKLAYCSTLTVIVYFSCLCLFNPMINTISLSIFLKSPHTPEKLRPGSLLHLLWSKDLVFHYWCYWGLLHCFFIESKTYTPLTISESTFTLCMEHGATVDFLSFKLEQHITGNINLKTCLHTPFIKIHLLNLLQNIACTCIICNINNKVNFQDHMGKQKLNTLTKLKPTNHHTQK